MSEFEREQRYAVIKFSHLTDSQKAVLASLGNEFEIPSVEAVVVEADWPEYEAVWRMIERRMAGLPDELSATQSALSAEKTASAGIYQQLEVCQRQRDAARVALAALREELATVTKQRDERREMVVEVSHKCAQLDIRNGELRQRMTAAEQRNAELVESLEAIIKERGDSEAEYVLTQILRALKPTESGASE